MKENKYDNPAFFDQYSRMTRSVYGLAGAGEWPTLEPMLPDFAGKRVLDLGCGYGWHCIYAAEHGAARVLGVDLSGKMLDVAREKTASPAVTYVQAAIEDVTGAPGSYDVVLSSLALHYIADFDAIARTVFGLLAPGGVFLFSCEHPIFTSQGPQDWYYGPDGEILHFPVDRYFEQGKRDAVFLGAHVTKYHRTLTAYLRGLMRAGFAVTDFAEPEPPASMLDAPGMRDERRRPMMMIVRAEKPV